MSEPKSDEIRAYAASAPVADPPVPEAVPPVGFLGATGKLPEGKTVVDQAVLDRLKHANQTLNEKVERMEKEVSAHRDHLYTVGWLASLGHSVTSSLHRGAFIVHIHTFDEVQRLGINDRHPSWGGEGETLIEAAQECSKKAEAGILDIVGSVLATPLPAWIKSMEPGSPARVEAAKLFATYQEERVRPLREILAKLRFLPPSEKTFAEDCACPAPNKGQSSSEADKHKETF